MVTNSKNRSTFIDDQRWTLLVDFENPLGYLQSINIRSFSLPSQTESLNNPAGMPAGDAWLEIDHMDFLRNEIRLDDKAKVDCSRFVFTTVSGMSKSVSLDWLFSGLNQPGATRNRNFRNENSGRVGGWLAFNVPRRILSDGVPDQVHARLMDYMVDEIKDSAWESGCDHNNARRIIDRHLANRTLLLVFDGLDHLGSAEALEKVLQPGSRWKDCHIGLGARPYAIVQHWESLFANSDWKFVLLHPFDVEQQKTYLRAPGETPPDCKKYFDVPPLARVLLSNPRILKYVRTLSESDLRKLRTPADVFYGAVKTMIRTGLEGSIEARRIGPNGGNPSKEAIATSDAIEKTFQALSAIAFEMVATKVDRPIKHSETGEILGHESKPNFERVEKGSIADFKRRVAERIGRESDLENVWSSLSALNSEIVHGIFDEGVSGLQEIEFTNRGIQEFLCAYYLTQYCGLPVKQANSMQHSGVQPGANDFLWDWIYLPFEPETHEYYDIWLYLTEMPDGGVNPSVWLESIASLYSPARRVDSRERELKWETRRSSEMIFRSWLRLKKYCENHRRAFQIQSIWLGEFENEILSGNRGDEAKKHAIELTEDFVRLPPGKFWMGLPDEKKGGLPDFYKNLFEGLLNRFDESTDPVEFAEANIHRSWFAVGKGGDDSHRIWRDFAARVLGGGGMDLVKRQFEIGKDEKWQEISITKAFSLARRPCTNAWYRLFSIDHGSEAVLSATYADYSESPQHPVIYVSFFDAFVFSQWARWAEDEAGENSLLSPSPKSCSLPSEDEWEYACKYGTDGRDYFWWGTDEFDHSKANANGKETTISVSDNSNPLTQVLAVDPSGIGLMDMHGNVWEWCRNLYSNDFKKCDNVELEDANGFRVARGGSFINVDSLDLCRSSFRSNRRPSDALQGNGFRLSRALVP